MCFSGTLTVKWNRPEEMQGVVLFVELSYDGEEEVCGCEEHFQCLKIALV